ncbi:MAG: DUF447 domain-containing protein [Pirellulales bacterium]
MARAESVHNSCTPTPVLDTGIVVTADTLILEGIVTTLDAGGTVNVAPMGPRVDRAVERLVLRPYKTSRTYENLKRRGCGVFHVVDDVWLVARAAVGPLEPPPETFPPKKVQGHVLRDACRWYEFRVRELDDSQERTRIDVEVVARGTLRDFFGFNRAKHAVVEAAILATRTAFLPRDEILAEFQRLGVLVEKTGGEQERRSLVFLQRFVEQTAAGSSPPPAGSATNRPA